MSNECTVKSGQLKTTRLDGFLDAFFQALGTGSGLLITLKFALWWVGL